MGKSVFTVSLVVIGITVLIVYLTGQNDQRTLTSNIYLSLSIIGTALFLFMTYGLYKGMDLRDDFPKFQNLKSGSLMQDVTPDFDAPSFNVEDGIGGIILSVLLWIGMTILIIVLLVFLEAVFWFSLFIILTTLYWLFFRALKLVFSKSIITKGNLGVAAVYALGYTALYLGWIFGVVYVTEILR